jgi:hypothetical protein
MTNRLGAGKINNRFAKIMLSDFFKLISTGGSRRPARKATGLLSIGDESIEMKG